MGEWKLTKDVQIDGSRKYLVFSIHHISSSKSSKVYRARTCAANLVLPRDTTVGMRSLWPSNTNTNTITWITSFRSRFNIGFIVDSNLHGFSVNTLLQFKIFCSRSFVQDLCCFFCFIALKFLVYVM